MSDKIPTDDAQFLAEVSWHYYINGLTQSEVAEQLGVTRLRVNQAIKEARNHGIVNISIKQPFAFNKALQENLVEALGIKKVLIAPSKQKNYEYHQSIGAALANYLLVRIKEEDWRRIGMSWGLTLQACIENLAYSSFKDLEIVSILGGTMSGVNFNAFAIASGIADRLSAHYSLIPAPIYLSQDVDRSIFLAQDAYLNHFQKFDTLDAVVLTASDISDRSYLIKNGLPNDITVEDIMRAGAIGDVVGRFLNEDGEDIELPIEKRRIGISLGSIQKTPEKILAAGGVHKCKIINATCKRGLVDTLITDDVTAIKLLELAQK